MKTCPVKYKKFSLYFWQIIFWVNLIFQRTVKFKVCFRHIFLISIKHFSHSNFTNEPVVDRYRSKPQKATVIPDTNEARMSLSGVRNGSIFPPGAWDQTHMSRYVCLYRRSVPNSKCISISTRAPRSVCWLKARSGPNRPPLYIGCTRLIEMIHQRTDWFSRPGPKLYYTHTRLISWTTCVCCLYTLCFELADVVGLVESIFRNWKTLLVAAQKWPTNSSLGLEGIIRRKLASGNTHA